MNNDVAQPAADRSGTGRITSVRVYARALEGMQKEAVICISAGSTVHTWRMVSDEGPYLNGTDLAPFPLAFYTAGMQFSILSEFIRHAKTQHVSIKSLRLHQDNYYTMEGSALQGTMIGGAKPAEVHVDIETSASVETIANITQMAERTSAAHAMMRDVLTNTFAITHNHNPLPVIDVAPSPKPIDDDLPAIFASATPDDNVDYLDDIITKVSAAKKQFGVEGGAGSSLQAEQKRTLHVHGEAHLLDDVLMQTTIQLYKPIGSTFRFICDETRENGGHESAPSPLAYLSAGIGFCYMTQLGRYAYITKQNLASYQIAQDTIFSLSLTDDSASTVARALPVDTHVYLESEESDAIAQKTVQMSERTCFLHAAMRGQYPSKIQISVNGAAVDHSAVAGVG
jgi:uncharacterized OsmC-like protein